MGGNYRGAAQSVPKSVEDQAATPRLSHPSIAETEVAYLSCRRNSTNARTRSRGHCAGDEISRNHSRLTLGALSERQALDYAASRPRGVDVALSPMSSAGNTTRLLDALIRGRSLTLDEIGARRRVPVEQESSLTPLWTALASTRQRHANLVIRGPADRRPEQYVALVDEARRAKELAERQLAEQSSVFRSELKKTDIDVAQVRAALPADSGLVSIVRFSRTVFEQPPTAGASARFCSSTIPSYAAFVLRPGTDEPSVVPLGRADTLEALIAQWRRDLTASIGQSSVTASETERSFRTRGASLRRRLWDPIAAHLDGRECLLPSRTVLSISSHWQHFRSRAPAICSRMDRSSIT